VSVALAGVVLEPMMAMGKIAVTHEEATDKMALLAEILEFLFANQG
jgi:hypothetical protein